MPSGKEAEFTLRLQNYIVEGRVISINLANPRRDPVVVNINSDLVKTERR